MAIIKEIYTRKNGTIGVRISSDQPSKTNPSYKKEVDVNHIIDRFLKTGQLTHTSSNPGQYIDQTAFPSDLQSAIHTTRNAQNIFDNLSKKLQKKFKTIDEMESFINDPNNYDECVKLGLLEEKPKKPNDAKTTNSNDENATNRPSETLNESKT